MHTPIRVTEMTLTDVVPDLMHIIDGSAVDVDGITAAADIHPAADPAAAPEGEGALLVTFTAATGRHRVAELELKARWREDSCWHTHLLEGELIRECRDCGTVFDPDARRPGCPSCGVPVTDPETNFGVHVASCPFEDLQAATPCQCEDISHEPGGGGHRPLAAPAGTARAMHVGAVCDECAQTHMAEYLLTAEIA